MKLKTYRVDRVETAIRLAKVELGAEAAMIDSKPDGGRLAVTFSIGGDTNRPAHWRDYQHGDEETAAEPASVEEPASAEDPTQGSGAQRESAAAQPAEGPAELAGELRGDRMGLLLDELEAESRRRNESLFQPIFQDAHLGRLFARLAARGFSPQTAEQLTAQLEGRAAAGASFEELAGGLSACLQQLWRLRPGLPERREVAPAVVLIGSAGAGKTAAAAKLAVRYGVAEHKRVTLVSVDPFRVGAVEALEAHAALLDMPLAVVEDAADLPAKLDELRETTPAPDWILVDTQGYGPAERRREIRLHEALAECAALEAHLTISATDRPGRISLGRTAGTASTRALIFTRLDETTAPGALFDESLRLGLPISFLTSGQNSLHDLIAADAATLTRFALGADHGRCAALHRAAAADDGFENVLQRG